MNKEIAIIDRVRGPQLSTSGITVLDLVPHFQKGRSAEEIIRWFPSLSHDEISVIERFYREHQEEFDEKDQQARANREQQINKQRLRFPEEDRETRLERMNELLRQRKLGANGDRHTG